VAQRQRQGFLASVIWVQASVIWVRASACTSVTPAVSYLPTGLAGYSVGPGISCGARKLVRTPRVTKKNYKIFNSLNHKKKKFQINKYYYFINFFKLKTQDFSKLYSSQNNPTVSQNNGTILGYYPIVF